MNIPYVKNKAQENVFPRIHSPTAPKIWTMPPKKMKTGLAVQRQCYRNSIVDLNL